MELAKWAFACTGICPLNRGIFCDLDFLLLAGLDFSDSQHAGTAFPDAKGDCTPVFDPELFPATVGSESLPSPKNLPAASTSQSPLQTFAASSSQSPTEPLLPHTAEDLLNRTPKQCNSHQLARALTESSRQQSAASYKKCSLEAMLNKIPPVPHEAERRLTIRKCRSEGREILTSSPFKIKLEETRQAEVNKADQHRKKKETRGKNCLNKSHETKIHSASKDDCNPVLKWICYLTSPKKKIIDKIAYVSGTTRLSPSSDLHSYCVCTCQARRL
jgi:hypothetical protein